MNSHLEMWPSTFNQLVTLQFNMHGFNLPYRDARALKCLYTQPHQRCVDNYRLRHLWCCIFNSFNQLHTYLFIRNCTKSFTHRFRNNTKTEVQYFYNIKNGSSIITSKSSSKNISNEEVFPENWHFNSCFVLKTTTPLFCFHYWDSLTNILT